MLQTTGRVPCTTTWRQRPLKCSVISKPLMANFLPVHSGKKPPPRAEAAFPIHREVVDQVRQRLHTQPVRDPGQHIHLRQARTLVSAASNDPTHVALPSCAIRRADGRIPKVCHFGKSRRRRPERHPQRQQNWQQRATRNQALPERELSRILPTSGPFDSVRSATLCRLRAPQVACSRIRKNSAVCIIHGRILTNPATTKHLTHDDAERNSVGCSQQAIEAMAKLITWQRALYCEILIILRLGVFRAHSGIWSLPESAFANTLFTHVNERGAECRYPTRNGK